MPARVRILRLPLSSAWRSGEGPGTLYFYQLPWVILMQGFHGPDFEKLFALCRSGVGLMLEQTRRPRSPLYPLRPDQHARAFPSATVLSTLSTWGEPGTGQGAEQMVGMLGGALLACGWFLPSRLLGPAPPAQVAHPPCPPPGSSYTRPPCSVVLPRI